jgi:DNA polymerase III delta prime subunit
MQLISGFVGVYLDRNATEEEVFKVTADRMELTKKEEYKQMVTSWEREGAQKTREEIALNLLREGMSIEAVARLTELKVE